MRVIKEILGLIELGEAPPYLREMIFTALAIMVVLVVLRFVSGVIKQVMKDLLSTLKETWEFVLYVKKQYRNCKYYKKRIGSVKEHRKTTAKKYPTKEESRKSKKRG